MKILRFLIKNAANLLFIGGGICVIFLLISIIPKTNHIVSLFQDYPAPNLQESTFTPRISTAYQAPIEESTKVIVSTNTPKISPTPPIFLDSAEATKYSWLLSHTSSPLDIAIRLTSIAEKGLSYTPLPQLTPFLFPIDSESEIVTGILKDPFLVRKAISDQSSCLRIENSGTLKLINSLDDQPDYYALPFFQNSQLCSLVLVKISGGKGTLGGWSESKGGNFPVIDFFQARTIVEIKTGEVVTTPQKLVYGKFLECLDPFSPAWEMVTISGQKYYVVARTGIDEDEKYNFVVDVYSVTEMHP